MEWIFNNWLLTVLSLIYYDITWIKRRILVAQYIKNGEITDIKTRSSGYVWYVWIIIDFENSTFIEVSEKVLALKNIKNSLKTKIPLYNISIDYLRIIRYYSIIIYYLKKK
jgi:hypothetical protein